MCTFMHISFSSAWALLWFKRSSRSRRRRRSGRGLARCRRPRGWQQPVAQSRAEQAAALVVEDDADLATTIVAALASAGYRVHLARSGREARVLFDRLEPTLVILDLVLPDADGLVLAASLKALRSTPIIVLSARSQPSDRVRALRQGADDFVAIPFDLDELLARVEALLRRLHPVSPRQEEDRVRIGELTIVHSRRLVMLGDTPIHLTPTGYRLLYALAMRPDQVVSQEALIELVWGYADVSSGRLIDTHLWRLRMKLRLGGAGAPHIVTVRGGGFALVSGVTPPSKRNRNRAVIEPR